MTQHNPNRTPLWKSIAQSLRSDIAQGLYGVGDKLPTESVLAKRFGVNRHTIRHALTALADDDLVYARRGAGVFVTAPATDYPIGKRVRYHQNLRAAGRAPAKKVLALETRPATVAESEALKLEKSSQVHVYEGISLVEDQPVALFCSVFPADKLPDLLTFLQQDSSVTAALKDCGVSDYTRASTRINAKLANATQALHLRIAEHAPILRTIGVNIAPDGSLIEVGRTWFSGDKVTLTLSDL